MIQPNVDISTLTSQASISRLEALSRNRHQEKEVDRVAGEFQSMCYAHLVKSMFAATEDSALFGDSHAAGILRSMFIEAISIVKPSSRWSYSTGEDDCVPLGQGLSRWTSFTKQFG